MLLEGSMLWEHDEIVNGKRIGLYADWRNGLTWWFRSGHTFDCMLPLFQRSLDLVMRVMNGLTIPPSLHRPD